MKEFAYRTLLSFAGLLCRSALARLILGVTSLASVVGGPICVTNWVVEHHVIDAPSLIVGLSISLVLLGALQLRVARETNAE